MPTWVAIIGGACAIGSASGLTTAYVAGQYNWWGVFVGYAMSIRLRMLFLFGISGLGEGLISVAFPWGFPQRSARQYPRLTFSRFVVAGIIPIIYWTIRRFSRDASNGVTTTWAILIAVIVWVQCWGHYVNTCHLY
jgi:hypothetical protein